MSAYDLVVVGSGPGGYVAAIRAAQLGLKTAIVERDQIGGLCLNWGCIPSKSLLYCAEVLNLFRRASEFGIEAQPVTGDLAAAVDRSRRIVDQFVAGVRTLLEQNKVEIIQASAALESPTSLRLRPDDRSIEADNIILATGGRPRALPGLELDGHQIIGSGDALALRQVPTSIAVVGGGPIGVEFAYLYRSYGAAVTIVEALPHLLPSEDLDVSRQLERSLKALGIDSRLSTRVSAARLDAGGVNLQLVSDGKTDELRSEKVLIGVGFQGNVEGMGLEETGVKTEEGFVAVDEYCRTNLPSVWAVGDVTGRLPLAHVASHQGVTAVEKIAGLEPAPLDYSRMPHAVYSQPQVASLGLTEAAAREQGFEVSAARFPLRANGKAVATGETEGFAKLVIDARTHRILGFHMIGHNATELLAEATAAAALGATNLEIGSAVHAHPTLAEAMKEAALATSSGAIHFFTRRGAGA